VVVVAGVVVLVDVGSSVVGTPEPVTVVSPVAGVDVVEPPSLIGTGGTSVV
jgi:hypothetical protein